VLDVMCFVKRIIRYTLLLSMSIFFILKRNMIARPKELPRYPFKCYYFASNASLQNSITTAIGAILPAFSSVLS